MYLGQGCSEPLRGGTVSATSGGDGKVYAPLTFETKKGVLEAVIAFDGCILAQHEASELVLKFESSW
eukprot:SAG11_NODE_29872_length_306_cov_0.850242_1_plen_66_part_01